MIALFLSTLVFVFFKATQQIQVVSGMYARVIPVSFCMALCEVLIVLNVVHVASLWAALPMGLGGALGSCAAMYLHDRTTNGR